MSRGEAPPYPDPPSADSHSRWGLLPRVLLAQCLAFVLILAGGWLATGLFGIAARPSSWLLALAQAVLATIISHRLGLRGGWLIAQCALPPLAWGGLMLQVPSWIFLIAFAVLMLIYSNTSKERVPLYLTNRTTWQALSEVLNEEKPQSASPAFVDLGCGIGGMLGHLAKHHPDWRFVGVETAPGPYLISKARSAFRPNIEVRFQNLWDVDLSNFNVVYAFLSPAPMPRLIEKAKSQMKPKSLLLSNSFWAPDAPYDGLIEVQDGRKSQIFFKRL